jgi:N-acyl-D-aspartate/D-glutamate deacylase
MGNCGVGFAPVRPGGEEFLIALMEGVEDIPGAALADGIDWAWESFPEYLDALASKPRAIELAAQVPHGAIRAYVLGRSGNVNRPATDSEIDQMAQLNIKELKDVAQSNFNTEIENKLLQIGRDYKTMVAAVIDRLEATSKQYLK